MSEPPAAAHLEGHGQPHGVEAQQLHAVRDGAKVLRQRAGPLPQPVHKRRAGLKAKPARTLPQQRPGLEPSLFEAPHDACSQLPRPRCPRSLMQQPNQSQRKQAVCAPVDAPDAERLAVHADQLPIHRRHRLLRFHHGRLRQRGRGRCGGLGRGRCSHRRLQGKQWRALWTCGARHLRRQQRAFSCAF